MNTNPELLTGLSIDELEALAEGVLAPVAQCRLDELLRPLDEKRLNEEERHELDRLLRQADQLTLLKTRARLTLRQRKMEIAGS